MIGLELEQGLHGVSGLWPVALRDERPRQHEMRFRQEELESYGPLRGCRRLRGFTFAQLCLGEADPGQGVVFIQLQCPVGQLGQRIPLAEPEQEHSQPAHGWRVVGAKLPCLADQGARLPHVAFGPGQLRAGQERHDPGRQRFQHDFQRLLRFRQPTKRKLALEESVAGLRVFRKAPEQPLERQPGLFIPAGFKA